MSCVKFELSFEVAEPEEQNREVSNKLHGPFHLRHVEVECSLFIVGTGHVVSPRWFWQLGEVEGVDLVDESCLEDIRCRSRFRELFGNVDS